MGEALKRYISRAPRYILEPEDNKLLYFAQSGENAEKHQTELVNVSVSGIAFLVERDMAPMLGDMIKFEFTAPGDLKMAWWGRVVRIEDHEGYQWWKNSADHVGEDLVIVALKFQDLPTGHKYKIHRGVKKRLKQIHRAQKLRNLRFIADYINAHRVQLIIYFGTAFLAFAVLYLLAQPTHTYDKDRGSPWGQRFNSIMWNSDK